uniref:glycosyltransferase n=1 Tax=uncultured Psychrobacter sp. TaxID=259303 RepID=UPI0026084682
IMIVNCVVVTYNRLSLLKECLSALSEQTYDINKIIIVNNKNGYLARATFQRIVTNTQGQVTKAETMKTEELYAEFFNKLSKSVFLEAQKI